MSPHGQRPPPMVQAPTPQPDGAAENGSVTTMVVIFAAALVLVAGLVYDGGMTLVAKRRAINIAEQAARAGAEEVSIAAVRGGGPYRLDPPAARAAALGYLGRTGYSGAARVHGDTIEVEVRWSQPMTILRVGGIGAQGGTVAASARSVHGVTGEEP